MSKASDGRRMAASVRSDPQDLVAQSGRALQAGDLLRALRCAEAAVLLEPTSSSGWHLRAIAHHHRGEAGRAQLSIRRCLQSRPAYPEAWNTLGNLINASGDSHGARTAYHTSIALAPDFSDPYSNLGGLPIDGRSPPMTLFRRALTLAPQNVSALFNAALLAPADEEHAAALYRNALVLAPELAPAWNNLGRTHDEKQEFDAAKTCFRRAHRIEPLQLGFIENLCNAAVSDRDLTVTLDATTQLLTLDPANLTGAQELGGLQADASGAEEIWSRRTLRLDETSFRGWIKLATAAITRKQHPLALKAARAATALEPADKSAWRILCQAAGLRAQTREQELAAHRRRVTLAPESAFDHREYAITYTEMGRPDLGAQQAKRAIDFGPNEPANWEALGVAYRNQWLLDEALTAAAAAISLAPDAPQLLVFYGLLQYYKGSSDAELWYGRAAAAMGGAGPLIDWNRSLMVLSQGDLTDGWDKYEQGLTAGLRKPLRTFADIPRWSGEDPTGKTFLITREQGVGDEFVFASCYADLIRAAERCIIECDPRLISLFRRSFPRAEVRRDSADVDSRPEGFDYHVAAGSLPRFFRRSMDAFPPEKAFLTPDPARVRFWRERFEALGARLVVGICWRGRLKWMARAALYAQLPDWGPILTQPGIAFVSLQYGEPEDEIRDAEARFGCKIHTFPDIDLLNDFDDVAAFGSALDLAITADTASGALMGALGVPTWRYVTRGDYMSLGTDHFPWMPSIRVFFRDIDEPWSAVTQRIGDGLAQEAGSLARDIDLASADADVAVYQPQLPYLIDSAMKHQQAGRLDVAKALYHKVLAYSPQESLSLQLLGTIALRQADFALAETCLKRAIRLRPDYVPAYVQLATVYRQSGRQERAIGCLERALAWDPVHPEAFANLGECLANLGRYGAAVQPLRRGALLRPDLAEMEINLGNVRASAKAFDAAELHYRRALQLRPDYIDAYCALGGVLEQIDEPDGALLAYHRALALDAQHKIAVGKVRVLERKVASIDVDATLRSAIERHRAGDLPTAEKRYRQVLRRDPQQPDALQLLGVVALQRGQAAAARRHIEAALMLDPAFPQALTNLGRAAGDRGGAERFYRWALRLNASAIEANINLGSLLARSGRPADAAAQFQRVLELVPANGPVWSSLGDALGSLAQPAAARLALQRSLRLEPSYAQLHVNLGKERLADGDLEAAVRRATIALTIAPDNWHAHNLFGMCHAATGREAQARIAYQRALDLSDGNETVRWNLCLLELQQGELAAGWAGYESGLQMGARALHADSRLPRWPGPASVKTARGGKPGVLVRREQGLGDELMFATCYGDLKRFDARFVFECDPRLLGLLQRSMPGAELRPSGDGLAADLGCDWQIPAGSLPALVRRQLSDFPPSGVFLKPDPQRLQRWRDRLAALGPGRKIGVCWRSSVMSSLRSLYYAHIEEMAPLFAVSGIQLVCLQHDMTQAEQQSVRTRFGLDLVTWPDLDLRNDLEDVAALAACLDLVITPATAMGGIAGAVGAPWWTFTNKGAWTMLGTDHDPWFPEGRVYTKEYSASWEGLIRRIADDIAQHFSLSVDPPVLSAPSDTRWERALAALASRRFAHAEQLLRDIIDADPHAVDALAELANLLRADGQLAAAIGMLDRVVQLSPAHPRALTYLGLLFKDLENFEAALLCHRRALMIDPGLTEAWINLANGFVQLGYLDIASGVLMGALALEPTNAIAWINLGGVDWARGDTELAASRYRRVDAVDPGSAIARWNLGLLALGTGRLEEGWRGYDSRFDANQQMPVRHAELPRWAGQDVSGSAIAVWSEQGIGDEIIFASCFPDLIERAERVLIECDPRLVSLWARSFKGATVRPLGSKGPDEVAFQAPSGDIARWLRPDLDSFPDRAGFLVPDPVRTEEWRRRVAALGGTRAVGICWRGLRSNANRRGAYTALRQWASVLAVSDTVFISLQYGEADDELAEFEQQHGLTIHRWADLDLKDDFEGVAALMASLDLVIGPDTAATALAAALGRPTWKLAPPDDWMCLGTERYPWLPSVRLFRKQEGDWAPALAQIADALRRRA